MHRHWRKYRKHIWAYITLASAVAAATIALTNYRSAQEGFIYPNIYIGDINFGGKTPEEAKNLLNKKIQDILNSGATIKINDKTINFGLYEFAADPDLSRDLLKFDINRTADELYSVGRGQYNLLANLTDTFFSILSKKDKQVSVEFANRDLLASLKEKLKKFEVPAKNAALSFAGDDAQIIDDVPGTAIDYPRLIKELKIQLQNLQTPYISAEIIPDEPKIKKYEVADRLEEIQTALSRAPFDIKYNDRIWTINKEGLKKYLSFEKRNGVAALAISPEAAAPFFRDIATAINVPSKEARFEMKNGKVTEFQTSQLGLTLDIEETVQVLNGILLDGYPAVNAIVKDKPPEITTSDANNLGISALLGTGTSNFAGSPPNRIHNIKNGADKLNGILIKPGEEFSFLKAIGPVNGETGFKQELVIKNNKTSPEFGGGLCQISTTVFRAALATGLPIAERKSHTYRVAYYEPAGMDATVYDPSPDLKFINDTPGYVLVQVKIEGTKLIFEFWGKKDGRETNYTKPVIYNETPAPPIKYIETADLPPGAKKKVETAHKGADAYFKYTVKYPDERGEISKTFYSHYRPWAEVWLVGASSTPPSAGT